MSRPKASIPLKRLNVIIPEATWQWLRAEGARMGITPSEFLRRVLDERRSEKKGVRR